MSVVLIILLALIAILYVLYTYSKWNFDYWKKRNVPHLKPLPLFGNYMEFMTCRKTLFEVAQSICQKFPKEPYIGTYYGTKPALIVQDPELIKLITTKDHGSFSGREISEYCDREPLTRTMFFTYGDKWKVIRQNISPFFTSAKIKNMFPLLQKCVIKFEDMLEREICVSNELQANSLMARFTMDSICSLGFGVETDTMGKDIAKNPFKKIGDLIFEISTLRCIARYTRAIWPGFFYALGFTLFPITIVEFFNNLVIGVFKEREYKPSSRNDFVDLVLNLKQQEYLTCESILKSKKGEIVSVKVDDDLLVAQVVAFFAAGFETSASTSSFTLFELAKNQEAQQKARKEIDEYLKRKGGKIQYDCVTELPYLEACIDESMRLHPALALLSRELLEPYELPSGLKLERGSKIHLPVYHLHHNAEYFPKPEEYMPERFLPENKANIRPYTYMPFGEGQRICLGMRVAKMQMLAGLITVLRKYRVELAEGMTRNVTLEPSAFVTASREPLRLKFTGLSSMEFH